MGVQALLNAVLELYFSKLLLQLLSPLPDDFLTWNILLLSNFLLF